MIRRVACVASALVVLAVAVVVAFAMVPTVERTTARYQSTMYYGGLGPGELGSPDMGMSDNLFRGVAGAQLELVGNYLVVRGAYAHLRGPILADVAEGIHIHHDPALYHLDTIVAGFQNEGGPDGVFGRTVFLTPDQQLMLVQGRLYMDVHTTAFPEGELRGMIVPAALAQAPLLPLPLAGR